MAMALETSSQLEAALAYGRRGWAVLPLHSPGPGGRCSCGNSDCSSIAKHPRTAHGKDDASSDPSRLAAWWRSWPAANVGIRTGAECDLVVLDVDVDKGGPESLTALEGAHGLLPTTLTVRTGSGGEHRYFRHPGEPIRNDAGRKLGAGLDVRGDGGYIVAPPSIHATGCAYEWVDPGAPLAELPDWLLERLREPAATPRPPAPVVPLRPGEAASVYGEEALRRELEELRSTAPGGRNHALNRSAFNLGQLVEGGEIDQDRVEAELSAVAVQIGLAEREAVATIASGLTKGRTQPRRAPEKARGNRPAARPAGPGRPQEPETAHREIPPVQFPPTDYGNAERLILRHGADLRYCHPTGEWLLWDGRRWRRDATAEVVRRAKDTVRFILAEAAHLIDGSERKALVDHERKSEADARISAMIRLAQSEPGIPVLPNQLDADPWALNCLNGTVDLRTGELRPHRREDLLTKLVPIAYERGARFERWDRFLDEATGGDDAVRSFLQRAVGYTATGRTDEEVLFFVHGPAAAGKSTFMEAIKAALGEYSATADFETFLARNNVGGPREDIARLAGARMVSSIEVDEGRRLAEGLVKLITGGDTVTARMLYKDAFEFQPSFALWLVANHAPKVRDDDEAMWRRILRVVFDRVVPRDRRDPTLKAALKDPRQAGPAVLAWVVEGAVAWHRHGLGVPKAIEAATEQYRSDMDPLRDFLADCCVLHPKAFVSNRSLRSAYEDWCQAQGLKPIGDRQLGERLQTRGCSRSARRQRGPTERGWSGIGLAAEARQGDLLDD
ncbi:MAG TPA: phage/plasmid primase, P4 family [Acidimicrobiales bacterium]|nr:phage/plasmid primase, P4 family [Acidimicrobiales bacterium]